jgi:hypothetical protein
MKVSYLDLPSGATITPYYSINRGTWISGTTFSSTVLYKNYTNYCRLDIPEGDFNEIQVGFMATATTLTPTITSVELVFNDNREEQLS